MRINKVTLKYLAVSAALVLLAASLANLLFKSQDPFQPVKTEIKSESLDNFYQQTLDWKSCYDQFECAMFKVPIDYENLSLGEFDIAVMQHRAAKSMGNLVINPGGPGGSGVEYTYSYEEVFTKPIIDSFNLVGFDPRGVGRSAPIKCLTDAETDQAYAKASYPADEAEIEQLQAESAAFAEKCKEENKYLQYYSTANAAKDMDVLRALLGDEKLNFLGKSYGTYLGTLYAKQFPDRVGRFVLDGAVDPTLSSMQQTLQQAVGFDLAFKAFATDCQKSAGCIFTGDPIAQIESKLAEIRREPISVDNRKLTESLVMYGIAMGLYDKVQGWPQLRGALKELFNGNGKPILEMSDFYTGRDSNGKYQGNEAEALTVISCADFPVSNVDLAATKAAAPFFGKYVAYSDMDCNYLPRGKYVTIAGTLKLSAQVLVIGTTNDPATPYQWAVKLSQILTNSKLISLESDGHTGYNRGSSCVDRSVEKYLISGEIPAQNLACSA